MHQLRRGGSNHLVSRSSWHPWAPSLAVMTLAFGAAAVAQQDTSYQDFFASFHEESVDVVEVQVPVHVVGKDGEPIRGLTIEDFTLSDNGKKQEILALETVDLDSLESSMTRSEIERALPAAARRRFLLLFDLSFSSPFAIVEARQAAQQFVLDALHPTDLAGVAVLSAETGPKLIVTFTPDRAQLARGIDTLGAPDLVHLARAQDPLRFVIEEPSQAAGTVMSAESSASGALVPSGNSEVQAYLDVIGQNLSRSEKGFSRGRVEAWAQAMTTLAKSLDSVRGRKHVVLFSEGFDGSLLLGEGTGSQGSRQLSELSSIQRSQAGTLDTDDVYGSTTMQNVVRRMLEEFQRADSTLQVVDISSLHSGEGLDRGRRTRKDALFYMAHETGGELFDAKADLSGELEEILSRSSVTYLLTFHPKALETDGSYHRLKIKVDAPKGARASFREGYYAPRPYEQLHPFEKTLLAADAVAGVTAKRDVSMNLLSVPFRAGEASAYAPVILEVDGSTLLSGHRGDDLTVEIYVYVTDDKGEVRDFLTQSVQLDLTGRRDAFERTGLKYYGHLDLDRTGHFLVRVVARNATTGRTGVETVAIQVLSQTGDKPHLLQPFFIEPAPQWFMVREAAPADSETVVYPFTVNGQPYVPAVLPTLQPTGEIQLCLVAYDLAAGDLTLQGQILTLEGRETPGGTLQLTERTITGLHDTDKILASFRPTGLEPGNYLLRLSLANASQGETEVHEIPFSVTGQTALVQ